VSRYVLIAFNTDQEAIEFLESGYLHKAVLANAGEKNEAGQLKWRRLKIRIAYLTDDGRQLVCRDCGKAHRDDGS
jgi:hypothetical protein